MAENIPAADIAVDADLVRVLLEEQHPDLASLPLRELANGWDNVIYRLGDELTVRVPRREAAAHLVEHEQRWLPELATFRLPVPIPTPVRVGRPSERYPWAWSVCSWYAGERAADAPPTDPDEAADLLGRFVGALHRPAPSDAPRNPYRGVPLAERSEQVLGWLDLLAPTAEVTDTIRARWDEAVAIPGWNGPPSWLHGDLHPANILVHEGRISAIVDFGDVCAGDPASDLAVAWMLLPPASWPTFRAAAGGIDDDTWARARGWALSYAVVLLARCADEPSLHGFGERTLPVVLADG